MCDESQTVPFNNASIISPYTDCKCSPILLVDDNDFNLLTLKEIIKDLCDIECDLACNGQEAVEKVFEKRCCSYKVIFMDIMMPVMDGFEATKEISRYFAFENKLKMPKIIALSAMSHQDGVDKCLDAGMDRFCK